MGKLLKGSDIAVRIDAETGRQVVRLKKKGVHPKLGVILVGNHKPSRLYVEKKKQAAEHLGIEFLLCHLPASTTQKNLMKKIRETQQTNGLTGLIIQLPLPPHIDTHTVVNTIDPSIDVDCLTDLNIGHLAMGRHYIAPPTAAAVFSLLSHIRQPLKGKNVTIIGTGPLVGKPIALMMMNMGASVTTCDMYTRDTVEKSLAADIIISGVGKKNIVTKEMVKKSAVVIGVGVEFAEKKVYGDIDVKRVLKVARFVTPTIGGVGPLTVSHLLQNTVVCAQHKV